MSVLLGRAMLLSNQSTGQQARPAPLCMGPCGDGPDVYAGTAGAACMLRPCCSDACYPAHPSTLARIRGCYGGRQGEQRPNQARWVAASAAPRRGPLARTALPGCAPRWHRLRSRRQCPWPRVAVRRLGSAAVAWWPMCKRQTYHNHHNIAQRCTVKGLCFAEHWCGSA